MARYTVVYNTTLERLEYQIPSKLYNGVEVGGPTSHSALTAGSLVWSASGHTGTNNRVAVFGASGQATYATSTAVLEDAGGMTRGQVHAYPLAQP